MRSPFYRSCHCILLCFVRKLTGIKSIFQTFSNFSFAAVTTNTRPRSGFFLSVETWVFVDINQLFPQFYHALWQSKVRSSLNEGRRLSRLPRIISIDESVFNYFIKMKFTLLKQRGLCELGEIFKTLSVVYVKVFRLFIYLIVWKTRESWTDYQGVEIQRNKDMTPKREKSFLWMVASFENESFF